MYKLLTNIMNTFAEDEIIFSNEQDFQFELSKKLLNEEDIVNIKLEALSTSQDWEEIETLAREKKKLEKAKKDYTDLIVTTKDKKHYAIELKYKTPEKLCYYETKNGKMFTMSQGAYDIGAYQFINDIYRLENINERFFSKQDSITKGYAILLTNDKNYRYNDFKRKADKNDKHGVWSEYSIDETRTKLNGELKFYDKDGKTKKEKHQQTKVTYNMLTINGEYNLQQLWKDYTMSNYNDRKDDKNSFCPGFSYLIVETACKKSPC